MTTLSHHGGFLTADGAARDTARVAPLHGGYVQMQALQKQGIRSCLGSGVRLSAAFDLHGVLEREKGRSADEPAYYYHTDHLGSTTLLTDNTGNVVQALSYLPYGEEWTEYNEMQRPDSLSLGQYRFNGKERDPETGFLYYGQRYYGISYIPMWLSVDPLLDKYPGISPYAYCAWNPVRYVDPDGLEKIISFSYSEANERISAAAARYPINDPVIHLWAHGEPSHIKISDNGQPYTINNSDDMHHFLCQESSLYRDNADSKTQILVMHSCLAGKGENSIAQQISSNLNLLVVAPDKTIAVGTDRSSKGDTFSYEVGVNDVIQLSNGTEKIGTRGSWNVFYKGVKVDSFDGHTKPIFKNPEKTIEKYEKIYQQMQSKNQ